MKNQLSQLKNSPIKKMILLIFFITIFSIPKNTAIEPFESNYWSLGNTVIAKTTSLAWAPNGKHLAIGCYQTALANDLLVYNFDGGALSSLAAIDYGGEGVSVQWSPDGKYLAIGGWNPTTPTHQFIEVYTFNGTTLTVIPGTQIAYNTGSSAVVYSVAWSPDGKYLAIGGYLPTTPTHQLLEVYSFNGTALTLLPNTQITYGSTSAVVYSVAWSPNGKYLAVGGSLPTTPTHQLLEVYSFNGSALTVLPNTQITYGNTSAYILSVAWTSDGKYLAIIGYSPGTGHNQLEVYSFNGSMLSVLPGAQKNVGFTGGQATVAWSPDNKYLAFSGNAAANTTQVYQFNGTSLTGPVFNRYINPYSRSVAWNPNGMYLTFGGYDPAVAPQLPFFIYKFFGAIDGVNKNITLSSQYTFTAGGMATGNVQFKNGLTLSRGQTLNLGTWAPVDGQINLEYSSILNLQNNLRLGASATLTSSHGYINGNGKTIFLDGNLSTIDSTVLHISSDTIIDGQEHLLTLGRWSQILVDTAVTLTLRNLILKNTINNQGFPPIKCAASNSKLALDNVTLWPTNDFHFNEGQLFIHNDVVFTGTSEFHYLSGQQSYIAPNSMLSFEPNTSFFYDSVSTYTPNPTGLNLSTSNRIYPRNNQLINMQDITSALYLDGCQLHVSHTGLKLTKGQIFFENTVTITNKQITNIVSSASALISAATAPDSGQDGYTAKWSPDGKYLAVSQYSTANNPFVIYAWNGTTLVRKTPNITNYGTNTAYGCAWSPDGKYIAVTGFNSLPGISIYEWNGSSIFNKYTQSFGSDRAYRSNWSPDGKYLAVTGNQNSGATLGSFSVFAWNGLSLVLTNSKADVANGATQNANWSHDGKYITQSTYNPSTSSSLTVWQWDTTKQNQLRYKDSKTLGGTGSAFYSAEWSPDDRYIAVCVSGSPSQVIIYEWDAAQGKLIDVSPSGNTNKKTFTTNCLYATWHPSGRYIVVGGQSATPNELNNIMLYSWDGASLTRAYSNGFAFGSRARFLDWSPDGAYLAVAGYLTGPLATVYKINYTTLAPTNPAYQQSMFVGNSALGASYDTGVNLLNNPKIIVQGKFFHDNVLS